MSQTPNGRKSILPLIGALALIAALAVIAIVVTSPSQEESRTPADETPPAPESTEQSVTDAGNVIALGDADAPVVMQEVSDFQ